MFESHSAKHQIKPFGWHETGLADITNQRKWAIGRFREFRRLFIENRVIDSERFDKVLGEGGIRSRPDLTNRPHSALLDPMFYKAGETLPSLESGKGDEHNIPAAVQFTIPVRAWRAGL